MARTTVRTFALTLLVLLVACGSEEPFGLPAPQAGTGDGSAGSGGDDLGGIDDGSSSNGSGSGGESSSGGSGGSTGSTGGGQPGGAGLPDLGTLVVLGDSISDGGGEAPYYYDLLHENLELFYGTDIALESRAQAGTTTMALAGQIDALPSELEPPVAVVITSGGNNMQYNVVQLLTGVDQMARDRMADHIDAALTELLTPDRFGAGVDVHVFEANIYDASDGEGTFGSNGCAMPLDAPNGSTAFFADWNAVIGDAIAAHQQELIDLHSHFTGHGFASADNWYASDCVHPNAPGHLEIAELIFSSVTGI